MKISSSRKFTISSCAARAANLFLAGLKGEAANAQGEVHISDLISYVILRVKTESGDLQKVNLAKVEGGENFIVAAKKP